MKISGLFHDIKKNKSKSIDLSDHFPEDTDPQLVLYILLDGNFACDCNRHDFFYPNSNFDCPCNGPTPRRFKLLIISIDSIEYPGDDSIE